MVSNATQKEIIHLALRLYSLLHPSIIDELSIEQNGEAENCLGNPWAILLGGGRADQSKRCLYAEVKSLWAPLESNLFKQ